MHLHSDSFFSSQIQNRYQFYSTALQAFHQYFLNPLNFYSLPYRIKNKKGYRGSLLFQFQRALIYSYNKEKDFEETVCM